VSGCSSSHRKYRERDQRITTHRVRLAALSRSRPYWLDEALSADWGHPYRHESSTVLAVTDHASELTSACVALQ
jgi:hypothetical protein